MKYILILLCFAFTASEAQKILLTDTTLETVSKVVTASWINSITVLEDVIDGFPKRTFLITDCRTIISGKGLISDTSIYINNNKNVAAFDLRGLKPKPGMKIIFDRIHVKRRPGSSDDLAPIPPLEFILTE